MGKKTHWAISPQSLRVGKLREVPEVYRAIAEVKDSYGNKSMINLNHGKLLYKRLNSAIEAVSKYPKGWVETSDRKPVYAHGMDMQLEKFG